MSGGLEVVLPWGDGEYPFRITIGGWRRIQDKCGAGPDELAARLSPPAEAMRHAISLGDAALRGLIGAWRVDDVREPIYQGLLGGGNTAQVTAKLMAELVDERPIRENVPLAFAIIMASLEGVKDDPLGESSGAPQKTSVQAPSPEKSSSPTSTSAAAAPVTRPRKSNR